MDSCLKLISVSIKKLGPTIKMRIERDLGKESLSLWPYLKMLSHLESAVSQLDASCITPDSANVHVEEDSAKT